MNTVFDTDPELLELIRRADPLRDPHAAPGLDTEQALGRLAPQLERPLRRTRGGRRRVLRMGLLAAAVAAAVFVIANLGSAGSAPSITPARAAMLVRRASAALTYPPGEIVQQEWVTTTPRTHGTPRTTTYSVWASTTPPVFADFQRYAVDGHEVFEEQQAGGKTNLYDPANRTIYLQAPPSYDIMLGPGRDLARLTVPRRQPTNVVLAGAPAPGQPATTLTITRAQADALRRGRAAVVYLPDRAATGANGPTHPVVAMVSPSTGVDPNADSPLAEVRYLLRQRGVIVNPHATLHGAPAIKITFDHGRFVYWAAPGSYRPLQSQDTWDRVSGITRYPIYRVLNGAAAALDLRSLQARHPGARIDRNGDDYNAALARLPAQLGP